MQVPPQVSAVKVEGERAYALARAGETLDLAARPLTVERLELVAVPDADTAIFEMICGKGGYVRSIARDLGRGSAASATSPRCAGSGPGRSPSTARSTGTTLEAEARSRRSPRGCCRSRPRSARCPSSPARRRRRRGS